MTVVVVGDNTIMKQDKGECWAASCEAETNRNEDMKDFFF